MSRIINLTEYDLNRIIRRVISESGGMQPIDTNMLNKLSVFAKQLSTELGQDIDSETIQDTAVCTIDEILPNANLDNKGQKLLSQVKEKVLSLITNKSDRELKGAFKSLKNKLNENSNLTEQVAAALVPFTLIGITAPIGIWIAIGVLVLILLIWAIVKLANLPRTRSFGKGCNRKTLTTGIRIRR
jgi:hypothetical protein